MPDHLKEYFDLFKNIEISELGDYPLSIKILAMIMFSLCILLGGYYWDITQQKNILQLSRQDEQNLRQKFANQYALAAAEINYQEQFKLVQEELSSSLNYLAKKSLISEILEELAQEAANEFALKKVQLLPEIHDDFYSIQPVELSMVGGYNGLLALINKMATFTQIITLHDFVIRTKENHQGKFSLIMSMTIYLYYEKSS